MKSSTYFVTGVLPHEPAIISRTVPIVTSWIRNCRYRIVCPYRLLPREPLTIARTVLLPYEHLIIIIIILSWLTSLDSSKPIQMRISVNHEGLNTPTTTLSL